MLVREGDVKMSLTYTNVGYAKDAYYCGEGRGDIKMSLTYTNVGCAKGAYIRMI